MVARDHHILVVNIMKEGWKCHNAPLSPQKKIWLHVMIAINGSKRITALHFHTHTCTHKSAFTSVHLAQHLAYTVKLRFLLICQKVLGIVVPKVITKSWPVFRLFYISLNSKTSTRGSTTRGINLQEILSLFRWTLLETTLLSFIRPLLEYAVPVWDPHCITHIEAL